MADIFKYLGKPRIFGDGPAFGPPNPLASNPAWQLFDLMTNPVYGAGYDYDENSVKQFQELANHLDAPIIDSPGE